MPPIEPVPNEPMKAARRAPLQTALATGAILLAVVFWGLSYISTKVAMTEVPPVTLGLIRFAIATAVLLPLVRRVEPRTRLLRRDLPRVILGGFFGVTIFLYLQNTGVNLTSATSASLIVALAPIVAIILDLVIFRTRLSLLQTMGIAVAMAGTYLVVTGRAPVDLSSADFRGNLLMIAAVFAWGIYTMLTKSFSGAYSSLFITAHQDFWGTIFLVPLAFLERQSWGPISPVTFGHILFLAVLCSAAAYYFYNWALTRLDVAATTLYLNLVPVVGVISGRLFLNEAVGPVKLLGGAIIITGIMAVSLKPAARRSKKPS